MTTESVDFRLSEKLIFHCVFDTFFEQVFFYPHGRRICTIAGSLKRGVSEYEANSKNVDMAPLGVSGGRSSSETSSGLHGRFEKTPWPKKVAFYLHGSLVFSVTSKSMEVR